MRSRWKCCFHPRSGSAGFLGTDRAYALSAACLGKRRGPFGSGSSRWSPPFRSAGGVAWCPLVRLPCRRVRLVAGDVCSATRRACENEFGRRSWRCGGPVQNVVPNGRQHIRLIYAIALAYIPRRGLGYNTRDQSRHIRHPFVKSGSSSRFLLGCPNVPCPHQGCDLSDAFHPLRRCVAGRPRSDPGSSPPSSEAAKTTVRDLL